jgi:hypothetical protein
MKPTLESYRERREKFISEVVDTLSGDERFVAAWLTGSFSRNRADSVSDIDISLVISEEYSSSMCTILEFVSQKTSPERLTLFREFGTPALIYENNRNAPTDGTLTFVMYADSAVMMDWILFPRTKAERPYQSKLLFDKAAIPVSAAPVPEDLEQSKKSAELPESTSADP